MSQQLIQMLAADFAPEQYHDEYRERVLNLIETKVAGGKKVTRLRPRKSSPPQDLAQLLETSVRQVEASVKQKAEANGKQEKKHARRT